MKRLLYIVIAVLFALAELNPENINRDNDNSQYSYSETSGWVNLEAANGGVTVTSTNVTGWARYGNLGWKI